MTDPEAKFDPHLMQLILSLQAGAMQQMGKVMSPITGKVERDLILARTTIDMIGMLETKMKGNLTDDEANLIGRVLYELRLNYVDETKKEEDQKDEPQKEASDSDEAADSGQSETESDSEN